MTDLARRVQTNIGETIVVLDDAFIRRATNLVNAASEIASVDDENFKQADGLASLLGGLCKQLEEHRKALKRPVLDLGRAIDEACSPTARLLEAAKVAISGLVADYLQEKERQAAEIEARTAALLQEAQAAEVKRDDEVVEAPKDLTAARQAATVVLDLPDELPKSSVSVRQHRSAEVFDYDAIPHRINGVALLRPDLTAIRRLLDAGVEVPGARLVVRRGTSTRTRRPDDDLPSF